MRLKLLSFLTLGLTALSIQPAKANQSCTVASYYGKGDIYHGRQTASGERFNAYGLTAAHPYLPFGTRLRVTDRSSGRSVVIKVNDRGPYAGNRGLDLSYGAFRQITNPSRGLATVCYTRV